MEKNKEKRDINKPFGMILILAKERRSPIFCNVTVALNGVVSKSKVPSFNHIFPLGSLNVFEIFNLLQPPYPYKGICRNKLHIFQNYYEIYKNNKNYVMLNEIYVLFYIVGNRRLLLYNV